MKIAVWKTGHEIADTVADALAEGFNAESKITSSGMLSSPRAVNIGYGILRGMAEVFRMEGVSESDKRWFNVDRGYLNPGHYDGYYRISYKDTQAKWHDGIPRKPIDIKLESWCTHGDYVLICPPTDPVCEFFGINLNNWIKTASNINGPSIVRTKNTAASLNFHLAHAKAVITFNSSIGWQALQRGIPVLSDVNHSLIGSYYKCSDLQSLTDKLSSLPDTRLEIFEAMAAHQFTLAEIRQGKAWELINHYLTSSSVMTAGKPSPLMSVSIPSPNAPIPSYQSGFSNTVN